MIIPVDKKFSTISTKYTTFENPRLSIASYDGTSHRLALLIEDDSFNPPEKLTVNLEGYGVSLPRNVVAIKDYSEHEGLAKSLEDAGVGKIIAEVEIGFGKGYLLELSFDAASLYEKG